jgi:hypothetical protein
MPEDEASVRPGGGTEVPMRCEDCDNAVEMALVLSPEEAGALGLHSLAERSPGERPEAP